MAAASEPPPVSPSNAEKPPGGGLISNFTADVIAIGSSVVAGAVTAWSQIESLAYKNMSSLGAFDDMKPKRKAEFDRIEHEIEQGVVTPSESYHKVDRLIEMNEAEAARRMEKVGVRSIGDRWHILRRHQKLEAAAFALVAAGVAIGSILSLTKGIGLTTPDHPGGEENRR